MSYLSLEMSVGTIVNLLSLQMQCFCIVPYILKSFIATHHYWGDVVKSMILMNRSQTINTNFLLIIETNEVQRLSMETAVDRYCWSILEVLIKIYKVKLLHLVVYIHILSIHILCLCNRLLWSNIIAKIWSNLNLRYS